MPQIVCNNCSMGAQQCPNYREGAVCAYNPMFYKFDTRNPNDIEDALHSIANLSIARVQRAAIKENLSGGTHLGETTAAINQAIGLMTDLREAQATIQRTVTRNPDGTISDTVGVSGTGGKSIIAEMLAKQMNPPSVNEKLAVELDDNEFTDTTSD